MRLMINFELSVFVVVGFEMRMVPLGHDDSIRNGTSGVFLVLSAMYSVASLNLRYCVNT